MSLMWLTNLRFWLSCLELRVGAAICESISANTGRKVRESRNLIAFGNVFFVTGMKATAGILGYKRHLDTKRFSPSKPKSLVTDVICIDFYYCDKKNCSLNKIVSYIRIHYILCLR